MELHNNRTYTIENTNTYIQIHKIKYQNDKYYKVSYSMCYKSNNLVIEHVRNCKLIRENITHWIRYLGK